MSSNFSEKLPEERRQSILEILQREGKIATPDLSRRLGVSIDTIRRDMKYLEAAGRLDRVHGGALPRTPCALPFQARQQQDMTARRVIAREAAGFIRPDQVVFIDSGTTAEETARHLPTDLRATIITPSPPVAMALAGHSGIKVIMPGGVLDVSTMALSGPATCQAIREIRADVCILGVCSIHPEAGVTTVSYDEVATKRAMIANSHSVIAPVVGEKIGTAAPYEVAPLAGLTHIITEIALENELVVPYTNAGITIITAQE
ncbi:MAG: DeoR/GlpR family DNA-binding transcription regulator [Desulfovibrio sp.]|uniref:DeoR/GlpR family DNA-binding transcription regulator n=1 Tax=Desulfovibrio sp. 7SRBS1 TaxID=3378064 RepID=UPI003B408E34